MSRSMSCPQSDPPRPLILVVSGERSLHTVLRGFLEGEGFLIMELLNDFLIFFEQFDRIKSLPFFRHIVYRL